MHYGLQVKQSERVFAGFAAYSCALSRIFFIARPEQIKIPIKDLDILNLTILAMDLESN